MTPDTNTPEPLDAPDLDVVLTHTETARMLRLCESGEAPPRIQLTGRRIGYWKRDVLAWLKARTSATKRAA